MCNWRDDEIARILEPDEAPVEKMVDARCQEQTVLSVQPFYVGGVSPRFAMAGHQMAEIVHARNAAGGFDLHYALLEKTLADSCTNDGLAICLGHGNIGLNLFFEPSFPDIQIIARHDSAVFDSGID